MKYLNIFYQSGLSFSLYLSDEGCTSLVQEILKCRNSLDKKDTLLINSSNGYMFINPLTIDQCIVDEEKINK